MKRSTAFAALASTVAISAAALVTATPASADTTVTLNGVQGTGTVGVAQSLTITAATDGAACGSVQAPTATVQALIGSSTTPTTLGTATFATCVGTAYQYTFQWSPAAAQIFWVTASVSGTASNAQRSAISPVPVTTRITAPSTVQVGRAATLTASVTADGGSQHSPQGTIQFSVQGGANIGAPVSLNTAVPPTAQLQWTPAVLGATNLVATYIPAGAGTANQNALCGTSGIPSCTSAPDTVQVTKTGVNVYLANPPGFNVGLPSILTAVISVVPPTGFVNFTANGANIATAVPVGSNGQAQTRWVPNSVGQFTIRVQWTGSGGNTGSAQDVVTVTAAPSQADQISLGPQGQGAWSPAGVYTVPRGTNIPLVATTASGFPAALTEVGPCTLNGTTLVPASAGQCKITAASTGGNGYGPTRATYTVNVTGSGVRNQRPAGAIRSSGRVDERSNYRLATRRANVTNAGQAIRWRVVRGGRSCSVRVNDNGVVRLRTTAVRGNCKVRATAPAVAGQWTRMVVTRTYRVR